MTITFTTHKGYLTPGFECLFYAEVVENVQQFICNFMRFISTQVKQLLFLWASYLTCISKIAYRCPTNATSNEPPFHAHFNGRGQYVE